MATKADQRAEITGLENRLIKWMVGLILPLYAIQIAVLLALLL